VAVGRHAIREKRFTVRAARIGAQVVDPRADDVHGVVQVHTSKAAVDVALRIRAVSDEVEIVGRRGQELAMHLTVADRHVATGARAVVIRDDLPRAHVAQRHSGCGSYVDRSRDIEILEGLAGICGGEDQIAVDALQHMAVAGTCVLGVPRNAAVDGEQIWIRIHCKGKKVATRPNKCQNHHNQKSARASRTPCGFHGAGCTRAATI
jgi:hypothetical protein